MSHLNYRLLRLPVSRKLRTSRKNLLGNKSHNLKLRICLIKTDYETYFLVSFFGKFLIFGRLAVADVPPPFSGGAAPISVEISPAAAAISSGVDPLS